MAAAFVTGAIIVPALAPLNLWPFLFLGFSAFYIVLSSATKTRTAFAYGWLFGFGYFLFSLSWIGNALLVEGNKFIWAWPFAVAGLPALLALFTATACALTVRFSSLKSFSGFLIFVSAIMLFEWLRGHILTGFPWNLYGYSWAKTLPIAQLAAIGGIYWLSLLTCLWATLPGFLIIGEERKAFKFIMLTALILTMGGSYYYGQKRMKANPTEIRNDVIIKLVQPNIPQTDKWNPEKSTDNLRKLLALSEAQQVNRLVNTIIIWPETAISDYVLENEHAAAAIKTMLSGYEKPVYLLSGVLRYQYEGEHKKHFNSLVSFDSKLNIIASYNKSHLVPFGEYIPLQKWLPLKPFVKFSGFEQGKGPQNTMLPDIGLFSPLVCYEVIFPGAVTEKTDRPDFIVNVTNDAWYGDSAGPRQHFAQTQFRAIEEGLPVIRAANTGISGIIDPVGRITYQVDLSKKSAENAVLPQKKPYITTYTHFKDILFFVTLCFLLILSFCFQIHGRSTNKN